MSSYIQLVQEGNAIIQELSKLQGMKFIYTLGKFTLNPKDRKDLTDIEQILGPHIDPLATIRSMFAKWSINCDIYLSQYKRASQIKSFERERNKVQKMLDQKRPDIQLLISKMSQILMSLDIVNENAVSLPPPKLKPLPTKPTKITPRAIVIKKGKPFSAMKEVEEIFEKARGYIKVMDKWTSDKTLDFFWRAASVPIKILTCIIEEKSVPRFQVAYRRIKEERGTDFEIRKCKPEELHDRYLITQDELWTSGPSLKDLGSKSWGTITEVKDKQKKAEIEKIFDELWLRAVEVKI